MTACATRLSGAHAISAPESEDGPRMCSLAACAHLASAGAEAILHLLTRDMNRISLQAAILGAASIGIQNVLCTAGRHQTLTTSGSAKGVFDIDPVQLLRIADGIRKEGKLADGTTLDSPIQLVLATDTNPFADPIEAPDHRGQCSRICRRGRHHHSAGPRLREIWTWMAAIRERKLHEKACIVAGILGSASKAERYNIPHEEIRPAGEMIAAVRKLEGVRGIHLMTGDDSDLAADILGKI